METQVPFCSLYGQQPADEKSAPQEEGPRLGASACLPKYPALEGQRALPNSLQAYVVSEALLTTQPEDTPGSGHGLLSSIHT